ncbi:MAG TPA: thioredoxin domain-containing protein [Allosphingosinicella sp.]|nr:thioredoxin domain-containing protein [Allosphingosinicella sp.]
MKAAILLLMAGAAAAVPAVGAPPAGKAPVRKAPATSVNWANTVVATPEGGFRMGNPAAKVKLIEYGSLTCDHCATFAKVGMEPLVGTYVRSGKVSYEYRNMVLNGLDVAATLVARCGGPARFFPVADKLYATQTQWKDRVKALTDAQKQSINALPEEQRLGRLADLAGIPQIAAQHGIAPAEAKRCLNDRAAFDRLGKMNEAAMAQRVDGTPTFFLNGENIGPHSWATLEPILRDKAG